MANIKQIEVGSTTYDIKDAKSNIAYGICATAADTTNKIVSVNDNASWTLTAGSMVTVLFNYTNSAQSPTLNVNNTGAKNIYYGTSQITTSNLHYAGYADRLLTFMYDGTQYRFICWGVDNNSNTVPSVQIETVAATAAKIGTCTDYTLLTNSYVHVNIRYTNTYVGALTLNIDNTGAKPVFLNGTITSSNNYNLKAGTYIVYYDGTNFYFRDDGKLTAHIVGNATTATTATKLGSTNIGSESQPIYLENGMPKACSSTFEDKADLGEVVVDDSVAYIKDVPDKSLPYAEVAQVGGMTRKHSNYAVSNEDKTGELNGMRHSQFKGKSYFTLSGTATMANAARVFGNFTLPVGTYTVSVFGLNASDRLYLANSVGTPLVNYIQTNAPKTVTITEEGEHFIQLVFMESSSYSNKEIQIMINEGSAALPYEPYFDGLRSAPVTEVESVGANLAPPFNIGYRISGSTGVVWPVEGGATTDMIPVNISGDNAYTWSSMANTLYSAVYFYNADKQYLGSSGATARTQFVINKATLTANLTNAGGDIAYIRLMQSENANTSGTVDLVAKQPAMLNKGTTALPYAPYIKNTLPIPEAVQALEGYGDGVSVTCFNYIDFEKKQFIQRVGKVDLGTLDWYISSAKVFYTPLPAGFINRAYMVSNDYGKTPNEDKNIWLGSAINIRDDSITTAAELKTALSGVMLYCELKEPVITDISHLLSDDNYIPVEGGGTITMVNEHGFAVPSTITCYESTNEFIGAKTVVGDLIGKASKAESADRLGNTNVGSESQPIYLDNGLPKTCSSSFEDKADLSEVITNSSVAFTKEVPEKSLPYAEIGMIGGTTRKCTNLIPYPYMNFADRNSISSAGVTWTVNSNRSFTVSGIATAYSGFYIMQNLPAKSIKYTLSVIGTISNVSIVLYINDSTGTNIAQEYVGTNTPLTVDISSYENASQLAIVFKRAADNKECSGTFFVMLNEGDTALPYEPYFEGLRSAPVTAVESVGVNLAPPYIIGYAVGDTTGTLVSKQTSAATDMIPINMTEDNPYIWSNMVGNLFSAVYFYNADKQYLGRSGATARTQFVINKATLTANLTNAGGDIAYIRLMQSENANTSGTVDLVAKQPAMLNKGSTALPYFPYSKTTLPIPEAVQELEGYGDGVSDTIYNYVDWENDKFVKRVGKVDMGTLNWIKSEPALYHTYRAFVTDMKKPSIVAERRTGFICLPYSPAVNVSTDVMDDKSMIRHDNGYYICDSEYSDPVSFKAAMSGVMLYYELAEPVITDISHLLSDDNYIPVESGGIITMQNEHGYAVPSTITCYESTNEIIGAKTVVGDLIGTAAKAESADRLGITEAGSESQPVYFENGLPKACNSSFEDKADLSEVVVDDSVAITKDVPEKSLPYAEIGMIGGTTRKCTNLIVPTAITNVGSTGLTVSYGDGTSVVINGTCVETTWIYTGKATLGNSNYILDGGTSECGVFIEGSTLLASGTPVTVASSDKNKTVRIGIRPIVGQTYNNYIIYPMLNEGSIALPYEPYFEGLRSAPVTAVESVGANQCPYDNISGTASSSIYFNPPLPAGVYTLSCKATSSDTDDNRCRVQIVNPNENAIVSYYFTRDSRQSYSFTVDSKLARIRFNASSNNAKSEGDTFTFSDIMLNQGNTPLPYTPYTKYTFSIPEAVQALDGYGWGINADCFNYIDWEKKQFVKRVGRVDLGALDWYMVSNSSAPQFAAVVPGIFSLAGDGADIVCGRYKADKIYNDKTVHQYETRVYIFDSAYTDAASFKATLPGVMLAYRLAEPVITDISHLLPDGCVGVEANGTVTMVNEYGYDVPSTVTYHKNENKHIGAETIVGNLVGNAATATNADMLGGKSADDFQNELNDKAPTNHASSATTYGIGTSSNYGHVKLSDSTSSTSAASAGIAASPKAVKATYDLASSKLAKAVPIPSDADLNTYTTDGIYTAFGSDLARSILNNPLSTQDVGIIVEVATDGNYVFQILYGTNGHGIYKRRFVTTWGNWTHIPTDTETAPRNHASISTAYGAATSNDYGHVKLSDSTNSTSAAHEGIAASPKAVKAAYDLAASKASTSVATASANGLMSKEDKAKLDGMSGSSTPAYTYGTEDLVAGVTPLATGQLHFVYE